MLQWARRPTSSHDMLFEWPHDVVKSVTGPVESCFPIVHMKECIQRQCMGEEEWRDVDSTKKKTFGHEENSRMSFREWAAHSKNTGWQSLPPIWGLRENQDQIKHVHIIIHHSSHTDRQTDRQPTANSCEQRSDLCLWMVRCMKHLCTHERHKCATHTLAYCWQGAKL